jgi:hypothetical protein
MMRRIIGSLVLLSCCGLAAAAQAKAPAPQAKTAAPQTKTPAPPTKAAPQTKAPATAPATKTAAPATKAGQPVGAAQRGRTGALAAAPETTSKPPVIMREVFDYDPAGRRDPFFSLLPTQELRPNITDLKLMGILYDETGARPIAVLREAGTNAQYRVTTGMTLGRMRVALIKRKVVIFSIEEFGLNRQDSLVLGDTSKVRIK